MLVYIIFLSLLCNTAFSSNSYSSSITQEYSSPSTSSTSSSSSSSSTSLSSTTQTPWINHHPPGPANCDSAYSYYFDPRCKSTVPFRLDCNSAYAHHWDFRCPKLKHEDIKVTLRSNTKGLQKAIG